MQTILLIEDNDVIREDTAEILEMSGYAVVQAPDGKAGVAQALAQPPDLVICDIMMPVLDGYGVLHIFHKNPRLAGIPFIFLTAKTEREDFRRGMELGADDYLTKPFSGHELLSAVAGRLGRYLHALPVPEPDTGRASAVASVETLSAGRLLHRVGRKQEIYAEGDEPGYVYWLRSGRVKTRKLTEGGKEFITGLYQAGDFFGCQALLEQTRYPDAAVAVEDSTLVHIPQAEFLHLLHHNAAVSEQFIRLLAGRVNAREQQLLGMAYHSLRRRVADTLLGLHAQAEAAGGWIQLPREDLASLVGTVTESLVRTLTEFRRDGLIDVGQAGIRVQQPEQLRNRHW